MSETVKKTKKCTQAVMKTCVYGRVIYPGFGYCDYIGMTGCRRGCSTECCDKYKKRDGKKKWP